MKAKNKKLVLAAMLSALSVAIGFAFIAVPNVEFFTATVFIAGAVLGPVYGMAVGGIAEFIYSAFNPLGAAAPPLLVAQVIGMAFSGFMGGMIRSGIWLDRKSFTKIVSFAATGFMITLIFDVLTTLSIAVFFTGGSLRKIAASFVYGMVFYSVHLLANTIIFASVVPTVLMRLKTHTSIQ